MKTKNNPRKFMEMAIEVMQQSVRNYDIKGCKCQVVVTEDMITVKSPGKPPLPITVEQLQSFTAPMLSRNPELHFVFARMGMAEEQGLDIGSLRDRAKEIGLPLPGYTWDDPYLVLKLYRSPEAATRTLTQDILKSLSKAEHNGWQWLAAQGTIAAQEYANAMNIPKRTALNHLKHFTELGLIRPIGSGPATKYEVVSA